jgi:membrane-bound serine protease (ClpP class)
MRWFNNLNGMSSGKLHGGLAFVVLLLATLAAVARAEQPLVVKMVLNDTIQPITEDELKSAIQLADSRHAAALLVELNTPGGLLDSTRSMAGLILDSRVPVILYVAPAGARAGSAGFFLLEAADVAAMAPGTNAGAAHPVLEVGKMDDTMAQKVTNDAQAFLRSYVTRRNRNPEAAAAAIESSHSYTAEEALNLHLIDLTASDEWGLLRQLDGREVVRLSGQHQTLHLAGARIELARPSIRNLVLGWIVNPNLALLLLFGGALLIYLEFNTPGTVVPGALGTVMVLLAIFALNLLPIRFTALLLLAAALALLLLEAKFGGHGVLASAGVLCLAFGTLTLVAAPIPEMSVSPWVALAVSSAFGLITVFLVRIAIRAKRRKTLLGIDALVGHAATALEPLAPEGHVLVEGEIWRAVAADPVEKGALLRVVSRTGRLLQVVACSELDAAQLPE